MFINSKYIDLWSDITAQITSPVTDLLRKWTSCAKNLNTHSSHSACVSTGPSSEGTPGFLFTFPAATPLIHTRLIAHLATRESGPLWHRQSHEKVVIDTSLCRFIRRVWLRLGLGAFKGRRVLFWCLIKPQFYLIKFLPTGLDVYSSSWVKMGGQFNFYITIICGILSVSSFFNFCSQFNESHVTRQTTFPWPWHSSTIVL